METTQKNEAVNSESSELLIFVVNKYVIAGLKTAKYGHPTGHPVVPSKVSSTCCCHTCVAQTELCVLWFVLLLVRLASPLSPSQQTKSVCVRNNGSTLEGIVFGQHVASALAGNADVFGSSSFLQASLLWSFPSCFGLKFQPIGVQNMQSIITQRRHAVVLLEDCV